MNNKKTDILIIGGGLAGLTAAIESKNINNNVTIVSKSKVGKSGNTLISAGNSTSLGENESANDLYEDIIRSGKKICDEENVKFFCENSKKVIQNLASYGVEFRKENGKFDLLKSPGHKSHRLYPVESKYKSINSKGLSLMKPLLDLAHKMDINILDEINVIKIIKKNNRAVGLIAYDKNNEKTFYIKSKVVIIAAGGGCNIYSKSNNTKDVTGDSYTLAMHAGVSLIDLEFIQFFPTMMFKPIRTIIPNNIFSEGALLRNINKEAFMKKFGGNEKTATRDLMTRAIYYEMKNKLEPENKIFIDCNMIPEKIINHKYKNLEKYLNKRGLSLKKDLIEVVPVAHYFLGGIEVNTKCETNIENLLACGEAAGGIHGANRLPGNGLSEAALFGMIAGKTAKEKIKHYDNINTDINIGNISYYVREDEKNKYILQSLKKTMWDNVSIVKSEEKLKKALVKIDQLKKELNIEEQKFNLKYIEISNYIDLAKAIIEGSLLRKESRGAHYREDYRNTEKRFDGNFSYKFINNKNKIKFIKK